jgi:signal transduction histidine kinase
MQTGAINSAGWLDTAADDVSFPETHRLYESGQEVRDQEVRDQERARLQRELHDGLGPLLSAISMQAAAAEVAGSKGADATTRVLELVRMIGAGAGAALTELRVLLVELRPPILAERGLVTTLRNDLEHSGWGPLVEVLETGPLGTLPPGVELAAYRIAREAVHNAQRHADAATIMVSVGRIGEWLVLTVTDDGRGCPSDAPGGLGLRSMRERASEVGGTLTMRSAPGTGVMVRAELPLQPVRAC